MQTETLTLLSPGPGTRHQLQVLRFGREGATPKATIQAALHADEVPAMLVARHLRTQLAALEAQGLVTGQIQLVPFANPLGLSQTLLGTQTGRFDLHDGTNFNRLHPDLCQDVAAAVAGRLGHDAATNVALVRAALRAAAAARPAQTAAEDLKRRLVQTAIDSDVVLDLHCDGEATLHLYALTPQADLAAELGACMGAEAILLATESGDRPFDEACTRPWLTLQQRFAQAALPLACFASTIELRGEADTSHELAERDARAIIEFLRRRGLLGGPAAALPAPRCEPTALAASEPVVAPHAGVVVFHRAPGERVAAGALIADVVDVESGQATPVRCQSAGLLYARISTRWATAGRRLAKVAGTTLARSGKLLSP